MRATARPFTLHRKGINLELRSTPAAFAVLDILGYGTLMSREPGEVVVLVEELLRSSTRNWLIQHDIDQSAHFFGGGPAPKIEYLQFSDTLLIWFHANPAAPKLLQTPGQLVRTISYAVSLTLASFIATGMPLRGAVGYGPVFVSSHPLFFTGKELYGTMKLEQQQAWAGAALHDSAVSALDFEQDEPFFLDYSIPMSDDAAPAPNFAIDWVTPLSGSPGLTPPWDRMFCASADAKVRRKGNETRKFFETIAALHRPFPLHFAEETIASMRARLARLLSSP
jgi:hypothetical protein